MPLKTSEPSGTSQSICARTFRNLTEYLHRNPPEPHRLSAPEPSGTSPGICIGALQNLTRYLHQNHPEPHQVPAPELSGTLPGTLRNLTRYLHRSPPKPHKVSAPDGTYTGTCTWTFWNLKYLHRNPAQPHRLSAFKPSETSPRICTGTLQNLTRYLPRNPPEPQHGICTGTLRNLTGYLHRNPPKPQQVSAPEPSRTWTLQNLTRYLHRNPPEPPEPSGTLLGEKMLYFVWSPPWHSSRRVVYRTRVFNVCSFRHWFHTTNHSGFASLSKFNFLKKYARTFHWICKKTSAELSFFCAKCSSQFLQWAWRGFCGNCFPISTAKREHASKSCHWARLT